MDQGLSRHRGFIFLVGYKHQANKETFNLMVKQKHKIKKMAQLINMVDHLS